MTDIQSATVEIRLGKKEQRRKKKKKPQGKNVMVCPIFHRATIIIVIGIIVIIIMQTGSLLVSRMCFRESSRLCPWTIYAAISSEIGRR